MGLILLGLILATPTQAGTAVAWTDPAGDATGLDPLPPPAAGTVPPSTPRPSDEAIDLVKLSAQSDGTNIVFSAITTAEGFPTAATGATVRFIFTYADVAYQLIAQRTSPDFSAAITSGLFFRSREPRSPELSCRECAVKYDPKALKVTVTAKIDSLASGIRAHAPGAPKLAAGTKFTDLTVLGQRNAAPLDRPTDVGRTLTADTASAGDLTLVI